MSEMATMSVNDSNNPSQSILSDKVTRALQVRTDTPAMKAALDALSHLHTAEDYNRKSGAGGNSYAVDSRSVRVAIEQDALHQALLLQKELRALLDTVQELREGVSETAAIAHRVKEAIFTPVVSTETTTSMLPSSKSNAPTTDQAKAAANTGEDNEAAAAAAAAAAVPFTSPTTARATAEDALVQEQKLAALLSDAFLHRDISRKRLDAVHAFLEKFDLSQEDSRLLDHYSFEDINDHAGGSTPNGTAFLSALERVRKIRLALTQTFGTTGDLQQQPDIAGDDSSDRLGTSSALRMMEGLAQKQEQAYERLYHWLQKYLHLFSNSGGSAASQLDPDNLDEALQHPFVKHALFTLRHVPAFYSHTLELVASSRRSEETRRFLLALTSGYAGFAPIEMKAHDSVAYVGDMLAFCFKAFSVEANVARGLIMYAPQDDNRGIDENENVKESEGEASIAEDSQVDEPGSDYTAEKPISAMDMLSISMSGLARPLKSRILQVVATLARRPEEDDGESDDGITDDFDEEGHMARTRLTHLYEICGLLLFYASAMEKTVHKLDTPTGDDKGDSGVEETVDGKNPLVACLLECLLEATKAYEATIRVYGAMLGQLSSTTGESESNLSRSMLVHIADVRMSSPGFSSDVACPAQCRTILSIEWGTETLVEAALVTCNNLDDVVALKQSLSAAKKAGLGVLAAEKLDEAIDKKEINLIEALVERDAAHVLELCGLGSLASAWSRWEEVESEGTLMATYPGLSPDDVEAGMKEFYTSLYSPPLPSLESTVKDPVVRKAARTKIAGKVCETYSDLYDSIMSTGKGGYDDVSFLGHTPDQVKTLFSA